MKNNFSRRSSRIISAILLVMCMFTFVYMPTTAFAYDDYTQYLSPYSHQGTVVCRQCNVRSSPKTSASSYGKLKNGQTCTIIGEYGEWTMVDLSSCGFNDQGYGFVKKGLIETDPYWIVLTQYTYLYATPWQMNGSRNGEQSDRVMLVIEEQYPWYAVQCCENTPGTSFVYFGDVKQYSQPGQNLHVIAEDQVPVYDAPWGRQISMLDKFTIVNVEYGYYGGNSGIQEYPFDNNYSDQCYEVDGFTCVTVNYGQNNAYTGYVKSQYVQRIIN